MRTTVRWMLPAAGAAFAVAGLAATAHADVTGAITAPTGISVGDSASWTFPTDGAPTTCVVTPPAGTSLAPVDCTNGTVAVPTADGSGTYTLSVWNGTDTSVSPTDSSSVDVVPAPAATTAAGTGAWTLTDVDPRVDGYDCTPDAAAPACTVTATGTTTASLTADLTGAAPGTYTWTVTAHDGTLTSAPTTVSATVRPPTPTTTPGGTTGYDRAPTWTVDDTDTGVTGYTCTVSNAPSTATAITPTCTGTGTGSSVALVLDGQPTGHYEIEVRAVDNGVDSAPLTLTYDLTVPPAPTTTDAQTQPGTTGTGSWTVSDADTAASLQCTVSGPDSVAADCSTSGQVALTLTGLAHGTYVVHVVAVDDTGTSPALLLTYVYAPPVPTVAPTSANAQTTSGSTRTITWTVADTDATAKSASSFS
jgi:hypothetical protein